MQCYGYVSLWIEFVNSFECIDFMSERINKYNWIENNQHTNFQTCFYISRPNNNNNKNILV